MQTTLPKLGEVSWNYLGKVHFGTITEIVQDMGENGLIIRYVTELMGEKDGRVNARMNPLLKVKRGKKDWLIYFVTDESAENDWPIPQFDSTGCKGNVWLSLSN